MDTSFHFASAQEITPAILDLIRQAYQEKPVSIYIQGNEPFVPQWQIQEVRRRDVMMNNSPKYLLDCDMVMNELEQELEVV